MLYRSPLTRWFLAAVGITTGLVFAFGDAHKWRSTESLRWLAQAPVPLAWWGGLFVLYGLLLLFVRTRAAGYATGGVLFAVFAISLLATIHPLQPDPKNLIGVAGMLDVVAFHAFSIRTAWAQRESL